MTAISYLDPGAYGGRDPVADITGRIEQGRARLKRERATGGPTIPIESTYPLFDGDRLVGAIYAPDGRPAFGPAAPAILLRRAG
jgi:hypothetical protein